MNNETVTTINKEHQTLFAEDVGDEHSKREESGEWQKASDALDSDSAMNNNK